MKKCYVCNIIKQLSEYSKDKKMSEGVLNQCKKCVLKRTRIRNSELRKNPEYLNKARERSRISYFKNEHNKKRKTDKNKIKQQDLKSRELFPEKYRARNSSGRMKKENKKNHLHHWSYNDEHFRDCIELNHAEHSKLHRYMIYDQERKMYRTIEGMLLDTKKAHINYYNSLKDKP